MYDICCHNSIARVRSQSKPTPKASSKRTKKTMYYRRTNNIKSQLPLIATVGGEEPTPIAVVSGGYGESSPKLIQEHYLSGRKRKDHPSDPFIPSRSSNSASNGAAQSSIQDIGHYRKPPLKKRLLLSPEGRWTSAPHHSPSQRSVPPKTVKAVRRQPLPDIVSSFFSPQYNSKDGSNHIQKAIDGKDESEKQRSNTGPTNHKETKNTGTCTPIKNTGSNVNRSKFLDLQEPSDQDVICTKSKRSGTHPGNTLYGRLVKESQDLLSARKGVAATALEKVRRKMRAFSARESRRRSALTE